MRRSQRETRARSLVTGGAGFIGSHLVDLLIDHDHDVVPRFARPRDAARDMADAISAAANSDTTSSSRAASTKASTAALPGSAMSMGSSALASR